MGCRCKERAAAIISTIRAVKTGDTETVKKELAFVATTAAQDATTALRSQTLAARTRLASFATRRR
jgi:hypothetical protein